MKKILISLILVLVVLFGCTQIPFSFNIPASEQYTLDIGQYGNLPVLFKDILFDQLQSIDDQLNRVTVDYLRIELEAQATGTIVGDVDITVYASTTEITLDDLSNNELIVATSTFTNASSTASIVLDSSTSQAFKNIIDYINGGGRAFHIAILVQNNISGIEELGIRITGGVIKGKFILIQ
ncbi:MAG: hypothetical protein PWP54_561 [Thermosipho sp. (in: thermotogales)]|nr:hypothetical protein [Thermosipho sp. (in: thermotogales)]